MKNILENLRKEKGLSQEEFGQIMRVSRQTIISLEKGKYNPSLELAYKISAYFKIPVQEIFIYEEEKDV